MRMNRGTLFCVSLALLLQLQCRSTPQEASSRPSTTIASSAVRLSITLAAPAPPPSGILVVGWYTQEELKLTRPPGHPQGELLPSLLPRLVTRTEVSLPEGSPLQLELPMDADAATVVALHVQPGQFWHALLGGGTGGNFIGSAAVTEPVGTNAARTATLRLEPVPASKGSPAERCAGPRYQLLHIDAPEVAGRVGNPTSRRVCVYLPASYASEPTRRYPTAYLLPGLTSTDVTYLTGNNSLAAASEALAASSGREVILVGVDTSTNTGSTYLVNSATSGHWEQFLADRVVSTVDTTFRTLARAEARALIGQSTGGFNAMSYGLRHSDVFTVIAASAPDGLDLEAWLLEDGKVRPLWLAWARLEDAVGGPGQMVSYASDWSADAAAARGYRWPFNLQDGSLDAAVFTAWRAQSPLRRLEHPQVLEQVRRRLSNRIMISVATGDEFDLYRPALRFSERLTELGIQHRFITAPGGHFNGSRDRLRAGLEFALSVMPAHQDGSDVKTPH